jgi:hypothetical protein
LYEPPTIDNIDKTYMHLTNFTLNKKSENYVHTANVESDTEALHGDEVAEASQAPPKRKVNIRKETSSKSKGKVLADDPAREDGDDGGSKRYGYNDRVGLCASCLCVYVYILLPF